MRKVVLASFLLANGCSLIIDSDGLSGSAVDRSPAADAAAAEGSSAEASTDAQETSMASDVALPVDASTPCAVAHLFCDDFEEGGDDLATRWSTFSGGAGASPP